VPSLLRGSFYAMFLGIITALLAAVPGFVDYSDIRRDHPGKATATRHMTLNLMVVAIYGINLWIRSSALGDPKISLAALFLSIIGVGLLSVSGYLGGRLIYDEGIAVGRHKRHTPIPQDTLQLSTAHAPSDGETTFVPVPDAEHLRNGETLRVEIDKQVMTIAQIDDQLYAFQEFCTHRFGPLSEGSFHGFNVQCPWHNSCFDIQTGKVTNGPAKVDLKTLKVEVRDGKIGVLVTKEDDQKT
jgi:nitrite reductase/ring-hydroxylating ferredoxin subunit